MSAVIHTETAWTGIRAASLTTKANGQTQFNMIAAPPSTLLLPATATGAMVECPRCFGLGHCLACGLSGYIYRDTGEAVAQIYQGWWPYLINLGNHVGLIGARHPWMDGVPEAEL